MSFPPRENQSQPQSLETWPDSLSPFMRSVITAASDLALLLTADGAITFVFAADEATRDSHRDWIGKPFVEVVAADSRAKARDLVASAGPDPKKGSEINHPTPAGVDYPVRYSAVRDGADGVIVLLGRDLRPVARVQQRLVAEQQAMEREYARLRSAETRYQVMFNLAPEALLVVDDATLKIVEANPAALRNLDLPLDQLTRVSLLSFFSKASNEALQAMLASARTYGKSAEIEVVSDDADQKRRLSAAAFRQDGTTKFLISLRLDEHEKDDAPGGQPSRHVHGVIENSPDGCVIMAGDRTIIHANRAFLDLAQLASMQQATGEHLDRWLGRPGIDLPLILDTLAAHGVIRNYSTVVRGEFGSIEDVALSAATAWTGETASTGFIIRSTRAQAALQPPPDTGLPRSVAQLADLVGRVPLKDLVRETSDVIEKLCIEAALGLSKDNRASAAQLLGLSRQSFYAKLRRHGLGDLREDDGLDLN